ncbi:diguanylate cyclase (GGDEF) domain-containing protein, partial [Thiovulum sp. ES]
MKIKNKILIPIIVLLVLFYLIIAYYEFSQYIEDKEHEITISNSNTFNSIIKSQNEILETVGLNLINSSIVKQSYLEDDPKIIANEFSKTWETLKENKMISEIHFFKPPAISFVNFSSLVFNEADVSKIRTDVDWTFDSCQQSSHMFACRKYVGFRKVYPIFDENENILGSLSVGRDLNVIPEHYRKLEEKDAISVYHKKNISNLQKDIIENIQNHSLNIDEHLFLNSDINYLEKDFFEKLDLDQKHQTIYYHGDRYFITIFDIQGFDKKTLGHIVVLDDITSEYEDFINKVLKNIGFLTTLIFLVYIILNKNVEAMTRKISKISKFVRKLQNRNFSVLDATDFEKNKLSENELDVLSYSLFKMGISLRELYENQRNTIDENILELKNMVYVDSLTKLPNRKAIEKDLQKERAFAVIIFDVDNFSQINNFFGANTGNTVLINIAKHLKNLIADFSDYGIKVYRIGSDEFGIIYRECKFSVEDFILKLVNNSSGIRIFNLPDDIDLEVDLTVGISKGETSSVENSDIALHKAKDEKIPYYIYDDDIYSLKKEQENNINLLSMIKHGILEDKFTVFFQPIFNSKREIIKYE